MSTFTWKMGFRPTGLIARTVLSSVIGFALAAHCCLAQQEQQPAKANPFAKPQDTEKPDSIPEFKLDRVLPTVAVAKDRPKFHVQMVSAALLPRDKQGIWVLDFSFREPLRIVTVDIPGKGRRQLHYLYYKVVNRTGAPRMFAPQFIMVPDSPNGKGERFEDSVIPQAIPVIRTREDAAIPVLGAVDIVGMIPPSTKPNVDDAVFGVAVWDKWDPKADRYSIYVRGLSNGYKEVTSETGKPTAKYKTLKIDFIRRGDEHNMSEKEIELRDPPYEWVYW